MARSRRRTVRRTTSQRAAGLIALALPAPVQRIADTRLGSLLMLVGGPIAIMFGLLNVTWVDGFPTFTFNSNKAAELRKAAGQQLNNLDNHAISQNWGQTTVDFLHAAQGPSQDPRAPAFPSTRPQTNTSSFHSPQSPYAAQPYAAQPYAAQPYAAQPYAAQPYAQHPALNQQQQPYPPHPQYPASYPHQAATYPQQQYPANYQQTNPSPYQQGGYSPTLLPQPSQNFHQQQYATQPSGSALQPTQQWQNGYPQQAPYSANSTSFNQGQQGGYPSQLQNYPLPSNTASGQNIYPTQGQYGRY